MKTQEQKAAKAAYMREYFLDTERREKKRQRDRAYYIKNKEKALARIGEWYQENRDHVVAREANRRYAIKAKAAAVLGSKCNRCGFSHLAALDFHHLDSSLKRFRLSDALTRTKQYSWEEILKELENCELICKNCHAIEHCTWDERVDG